MKKEKTNYNLLIAPVVLNILIYILSAFVFGTFDVSEWNTIFKVFVASFSFILTFSLIMTYFQTKN